MSKLVNKNLITLKCVLFCFLSGVGCIFPYLPLHMLHVGLNRGEARLISAVAPCVAILGPAVLGCLIDKLSVGRGSTGGVQGTSGSGKLLRMVTAICLILSALFYTLLLAVPYTERHEARRPQVLFMCDADNTYVMQEVCKEDMLCNSWSGVKTGVLAVTSCEYGCADDNMTWVKQPFPTTTTTTMNPAFYTDNRNMSSNFTSFDEVDEDEYEIYPPHLCYDGQCLVYMAHSRRMRVPMSLEAPTPPADNSSGTDSWCTYRASSPSCSVPSERLPESSVMESECKPAVRCQVLDPYDEPDGVLADAECRLTIGDPAYTFTVVPHALYQVRDPYDEPDVNTNTLYQELDPYDEPDGVLADAECRRTIGVPVAIIYLHRLFDNQLRGAAARAARGDKSHIKGIRYKWLHVTIGLWDPGLGDLPSSGGISRRIYGIAIPCAVRASRRFHADRSTHFNIRQPYAVVDPGMVVAHGDWSAGNAHEHGAAVRGRNCRDIRSRGSTRSTVQWDRRLPALLLRNEGLLLVPRRHGNNIVQYSIFIQTVGKRSESYLRHSNSIRECAAAPRPRRRPNGLNCFLCS
ncbi:hypothetical protein evm_005872 [Chilo suppressalis]|nr:hypothetical protein evm_005872 [Chilo suppressalis]